MKKSISAKNGAKGISIWFQNAINESPELSNTTKFILQHFIDNESSIQVMDIPTDNSNVALLTSLNEKKSKEFTEFNFSCFHQEAERFKTLLGRLHDYLQEQASAVQISIYKKAKSMLDLIEKTEIDYQTLHQTLSNTDASSSFMEQKNQLEQLLKEVMHFKVLLTNSLNILNKDLEQNYLANRTIDANLSASMDDLFTFQARLQVAEEFFNQIKPLTDYIQLNSQQQTKLITQASAFEITEEEEEDVAELSGQNDINPHHYKTATSKSAKTDGEGNVQKTLAKNVRSYSGPNNNAGFDVGEFSYSLIDINRRQPSLLFYNYAPTQITFNVTDAIEANKVLGNNSQDNASIVSLEKKISSYSNDPLKIFPSHEQLYDIGIWDNNVNLDPTKFEPIFIFHAYKDSREVGTAYFYNHPFICKHEASNFHNIVQLDGVLKELKLDPHLKLNWINEACQSLPPTFAEVFKTTAISSATHGAIKGATNLISYGLQKKQMSEQVAQGISQALFYGTYFAVQCYNQYTVNETLKNFTSYGDIAYKALADTGMMFVTSQYVSKASQGLIELGNKMIQKGNTKFGTLLNKVGIFGGPTVYLINNAANQGVSSISKAAKSFFNAATAMTVGSITEDTINKAGQVIIDKVMSAPNNNEKAPDSNEISENNLNLSLK